MVEEIRIKQRHPTSGIISVTLLFCHENKNENYVLFVEYIVLESIPVTWKLTFEKKFGQKEVQINCRYQQHFYALTKQVHFICSKLKPVAIEEKTNDQTDEW